MEPQFCGSWWHRRLSVTVCGDGTDPEVKWIFVKCDGTMPQVGIGATGVYIVCGDGTHSEVKCTFVKCDGTMPQVGIGATGVYHCLWWWYSSWGKMNLWEMWRNHAIRGNWRHRSFYRCLWWWYSLWGKMILCEMWRNHVHAIGGNWCQRSSWSVLVLFTLPEARWNFVKCDGSIRGMQPHHPLQLVYLYQVQSLFSHQQARGSPENSLKSDEQERVKIYVSLCTSIVMHW